MPQFLVPIISAIGAAVGGAVGAGLIMYAGYIAVGVVLLGTMAYSSYQKRKAERAARAQYDAAQVDRFANMPATVASRELVLGRVRKGGNVFFRGSSGQFKQFFAMCITLAAHEIDGVEQIYFNDIPITTDIDGNVLTAPFARYPKHTVQAAMSGNTLTLDGTPIEGSLFVSRRNVTGSSEDIVTEEVPYTVVGVDLTITGYDPLYEYIASYQYTTFYSTAIVRTYLGAPGQTADARLQMLYPGVWTPDHRVDGVAYMVCEFQYDETSLPSGLPNVTALVRGAKLYDPRTGLTVFSEDPALMMRHVMAHPYFGKRTSFSAAEDARIVAAANACEAAIDYGGGTVSTYRAAVVIPYGAPPRDVLDDLSQAMGGQWAYAAGELFMRAGVYQSPVMSLTDADLAVVQRGNDGSTTQSPITISTHRPRNEKVNSVVCRIWDQAAGYVQTPIMPMRVDAFVTADGAELVQEVTMPAVFYAYQAFAVAAIMLRDSRDPLTVTLPFKLTAYKIELFDSVTLTLARYGWVSKEFQVLGRTFLPDGSVQLTLKETSAAIFQWGAGFVPSGYATNTTLPEPWNITPPEIATLASGEDQLIVQTDGTVINGVVVTWAAVQDASVTDGGGSIEVQYAHFPYDAWHSIRVPGGDTRAVIVGVPDNVWVVVRLRSRSSLAISDWSVQQWVQATGKSAPPPNMENLTIAGSVLSWTIPRRVPDLAGYVLRFHYGNNLDWNSATPMHTGVLTQSPFDLVTRPSGPVTIMGKAIDTSGNVSANSANIVMNLGDARIANVVEQWDFDALGWPYAAGEQSGWTLVSGNPTAGALDSFYGTDDQSFYGVDTESFYDASAYSQMVYVTNEIVVSSALAGSVMTLTVQAQGIDLRIEYRLSGPAPFYGPDGDSFYGDDAEPLYGPPGAWLPWPGQIIAARDVYQFRVTIGAGTIQGILQSMVLTIDAPDMGEELADVPISAGGTAVPFTKPFSSIKTLQATLQANGSGAVTVEVDKTIPLAPVIRAFNSSHVAVSGATADISIQGY